MSEDRDESTGQFTEALSSEGLFGQQGLEAESGFRQMPVANPVKADEDDYSVDEKIAAEIFSDVRGEESPILPVEYQNAESGEPYEASAVVSLEQAAHDLTAWRGAQDDGRAASISNDFAKEVDRLRSEAYDADPVAAIESGIEPPVEDAGKAEQSDAKVERPAVTKDGDLDPVLAEQIRQHPQVRQFIADEVAESQQVRQQYSAGLEQARIASLATLAEVVPHLSGLDPARFEEGLQLLAQVDPPAFQQAMNILGRTNQIVQAQQQAAQHQQQIQYQQFEASVKSEDARLVEMVGSTKAANEANQALVDYLTEHGVNPNQRLNIVMQNPVLRTAEARQTIWKAAKYDAMVRAPKAVAAKELPPVQRPGVARSRGDYNAESIDALNTKFSRSGSEKDAVALILARRSRG